MKCCRCAALLAWGAMMGTLACGDEGVVAVELDTATVICKEFLGFSVEWDSNGYNGAGINDADFAVIRKRVEWMRLPIARIIREELEKIEEKIGVNP